jgi:hypothetical protein
LEVLVATTVLAVMLVLVASMLNSASNSTATATGRLETASDARIAFDRLATDLATLVWDGSATLIAGKSPTPASTPLINDSLAFLCRSRSLESPDVAPGRFVKTAFAVRNFQDISLGVDWEIPMLIRGTANADWSLTRTAALESAEADWSIHAAASASGMFRKQISDRIFRMALCFHLTNGKILPNVPANAEFPLLEGFPNSGNLSAHGKPIDLTKITAITVAFAAIDAKSFVLSAADLDLVAKNLPMPGEDELPLGAWQKSSVDPAEGLSGGSAKKIRENLRFYQRTFPIQVK